MQVALEVCGKDIGAEGRVGCELLLLFEKKGPERFERKTSFRIQTRYESTNRMKTRVQLFYTYPHLLQIALVWGGSGIYTARVLNPTFHWLFRQHKDHSFLQVLAQEAHMVIMSRAFVFLNCDIGTERAIIEEMRDITCVSQTMTLQSL